MSDTIELTRICGVDEVEAEEILRVETDAFGPVCVTKYDGEIYVFPDKCPHADEALAEGLVEDGRIVCPVHFAEFELGTGEAHNEPTGCDNLKFFECVERENGVFAKLN